MREFLSNRGTLESLVQVKSITVAVIAEEMIENEEIRALRDIVMEIEQPPVRDYTTT